MRYYSFLDPTLFNNTDSKKAGQLLIQDKFYGFTKQLITLAEEQAEARKLLDESKLKIRFIFEEKNFSNEIIFGTNVLSSDKKNEILNKLYLLVIDSYTLYLNELNSEFYKTFKDEIFGLDFQDQRKIALKYYKEIYKNICVEETNFVDNIKAKEINDNTNLSKLDVIFKQKIIYKDNLIPIAKLIFNLLDEKKFTKNFKLKFTIIDEILNYEIWKQIMVELNNEFDFEEDLFSTDGINDRATYEKYSHIFNSYEAYCFTKIKIDSFKTYPKAKSVALYQMLADYYLIKENHDNYKNYIETEFGFRPSKIVKYEEKIRPSYDNRIKEYKEDWVNMTAKKQ